MFKKLVDNPNYPHGWDLQTRIVAGVTKSCTAIKDGKYLLLSKHGVPKWYGNALAVKDAIERSFGRPRIESIVQENIDELVR